MVIYPAYSVSSWYAFNKYVEDKLIPFFGKIIYLKKIFATTFLHLYLKLNISLVELLEFP